MSALLFQALLLMLVAFGLGLLIGWMIKKTFCQLRYPGVETTLNTGARRTLVGGETGSLAGGVATGGAAESAAVFARDDGLTQDDPEDSVDLNASETADSPAEVVGVSTATPSETLAEDSASENPDVQVRESSLLDAGASRPAPSTDNSQSDLPASKVAETAAVASKIEAGATSMTGSEASAAAKDENSEAELTERDVELIEALQAELNGNNANDRPGSSAAAVSAADEDSELSGTHNRSTTLADMSSRTSLDHDAGDMEQLSLTDLEDAQIAAAQSGDEASAGSAASARLAGATGFLSMEPDNLEIIEGIGPKMQSILYENGISSWSVLATQSVDDLKRMLAKYGGRYQIIDPSEWIAQAKLAAAGKPDELIALQQRDGVSKLERMLDSGVNSGFGRYKKDDLKIVEGIGPKIEELLRADGIDTWKALAKREPEQIREILQAAGPRYRLADPATWPKQADYADKAEWDTLRRYQSTLKGGRK